MKTAREIKEKYQSITKETCEGCARAITTQQVIWYSKTYLKDDDGKYIT